MKHQQTILLLALCAAVAACSVSDTTISNGKDGSIKLNGNTVTLEIDGVPDAVISSSGDMRIDDKPISVTPSQQGLLVLYYQNVRAIRDQAVTLGKGVGMEALKSKLGGPSDENAKKKLEDSAEQQARQYALKVCQDQTDIKTVQDQLATQIPAFKPYGGIISDKSIADCVKDAND